MLTGNATADEAFSVGLAASAVAGGIVGAYAALSGGAADVAAAAGDVGGDDLGIGVGRYARE